MMEEKDMQQDAPVLHDYKKTMALHKKKRHGGGQKTAAAIMDFAGDNRQYLVLFGVLVLALAVILGSALGLKIPAAAVCVMVVLEAVMAACLHDVPVWLHALVAAAQIVAGALCGKTALMVLCVLIYVAAILSLRFLRE